MRLVHDLLVSALSFFFVHSGFSESFSRHRFGFQAAVLKVNLH